MPPKSTEFERLTFLPVQHVRWGFTRYGMYDQGHRPVRSWPILISADSRFPYMPKTPATGSLPALSGSFIYGGLFDERFGHFVTETVPNLLAAKHCLSKHPGARIICHKWLRFDLDNYNKPYPHIDYFLKLFELCKSDFVFVDQPVIAENVVVPPSPFTKKYLYSKHGLDLIDRQFNPDGRTSGDRLYLSRTKWPKKRVTNEDRIEGFFADRGYEILHLQDHSLDEQLEIVTRAQGFAGPQGTALHWSLFSKPAISVMSLGWKSPLQAGICKSRGIKYRENRGIMTSLRDPRLRRISEHRLSRMLD